VIFSHSNFSLASWVWISKAPSGSHVAEFRHRFPLNSVGPSVQLLFSADSTARVFLNGHWIADGPCRGWPESYYFDVVPITHALKEGENELTALVRFHGDGTFQHLPQRPGFLFEIRDESGVLAASGSGTEGRLAKAWRAATPKVSIQNPPFEWVDSRQVADDWRQCEVICDAYKGPWKGLHERDVALLEHSKVLVAREVSRAVRSNPPGRFLSAPVIDWNHPGLRTLNTYTSRGCGLAVIVICAEEKSVQWSRREWRVFVNGEEAVEHVHWRAGLNCALFLVRKHFTHMRDAVLEIPEGILHPVFEGDGVPWRFVKLPEFSFVGNDMHWGDHAEPFRDKIANDYADFCAGAGIVTTNAMRFREWLKGRSQPIDLASECCPDPAADFEARVISEEFRSISEDAPDIDSSAGVCRELRLDFPSLSSGYLELEIEASEGTVVDLFAVEHVSPDGRIQHTMQNRNGFRYVCREGHQVFRTLGRHFGKHVFAAVSEGRARLHTVRMIESLYPAKRIGSFECSDPALNGIWEASCRTMELCMHDVFVDSLYEQTLWTGDAAVQQLYALWTFDARDISRRSMRLGAESLSRFPMVGAQVPSAWECLLPAWSFLWGISVRDDYFYSGEIEILEEMWPAVRKNILGAETFLNEQGLFDAPFWNLLEWAPMEFKHTCVIYNTQLMLAAVEAGFEVAGWLKRPDDKAWLGNLARRLRHALDQVRKQSGGFFPDALSSGGQPCGRSLHPHFLALCFGQVSGKAAADFTRFLENPPPETTGIASPFMTHFLYGAWERAARPERLISDLRRHFQPMIDAGYETLWETLPGATCAPQGWPTRSRCHGWSASPLYYLPRSVLGIRPTGTGSRSFEILPHLGALQWAEGSIATPRGPLHVRIEKRGGHDELVACEKPEGIETAGFVRLPDSQSDIP